MNRRVELAWSAFVVVAALVWAVVSVLSFGAATSSTGLGFLVIALFAAAALVAVRHGFIPAAVGLMLLGMVAGFAIVGNVLAPAGTSPRWMFWGLLPLALAFTGPIGRRRG